MELKKKDFRGLSLYFTEECNMSAARTNRLKSSVNSMLTFCEEDDDYDYEVNFAKKVAGLPKERVKDDEDDFFYFGLSEKDLKESSIDDVLEFVVTSYRKIQD